MRTVVLAVVGLVLMMLGMGAPSARGAVPPERTGPRLGINLAGPCDWNTELPFVDVFRLSREWISQKEGAGWGNGPKLELDEHGWVKKLATGCFAETPLCTIEGGHYPSGQYTVLYEGEGKLGFTGAAKEVLGDRMPAGVMLINVDASKGGFFLQIRQTNPANYVRNIRVIMPGFEKTYATEPFHPLFLKRWAGVACFRFMDWMDTNGSKVEKWADRPKVEDATFTLKGMALEVMIDLCNRQKADAWFCMPERADDEYVREFAKVVKEKLDPGLKVHIEYSNEVWNSMFASHQYAEQKGKELKLGEASRPWEGAAAFYVKRSIEIFKVWEQVFGGRERLVRVLAWQAASGEYWLDGMVMAKTKPGEVDALAIAPYMGFMPSGQGGDGPTADKVAKWSVDQVLDEVERKVLPESVKHMADAAKVARKYKVKLVSYEAGQHLVGVGGGENNEALTKVLMAANRSPRMGKIYGAYFKAWEDAGGDLMCYFSSVSSWSKWGSWGLIQYADEDESKSAKFTATMQWAQSRGQGMNLVGVPDGKPARVP